MRLHTEQSYWWRSKFLGECAWIVTCVHARTYASMLVDVTRACMAREILLQLSTDTHEFEKYSREGTKYTRVTRTRASSLNRAVLYVIGPFMQKLLYLHVLAVIHTYTSNSHTELSYRLSIYR